VKTTIRIYDYKRHGGTTDPDLALRGVVPLVCDCGSAEFGIFGPLKSDDSIRAGDPGLRWWFVCEKCHEEIRVYQTGEAYRAVRQRETNPAARKARGLPTIDQIRNLLHEAFSQIRLANPNEACSTLWRAIGYLDKLKDGQP